MKRSLAVMLSLGWAVAAAQQTKKPDGPPAEIILQTGKRLASPEVWIGDCVYGRINDEITLKLPTGAEHSVRVSLISSITPSPDRKVDINGFTAVVKTTRTDDQPVTGRPWNFNGICAVLPESGSKLLAGEFTERIKWPRDECIFKFTSPAFGPLKSLFPPMKPEDTYARPCALLSVLSRTDLLLQIPFVFVKNLTFTR